MIFNVGLIFLSLMADTVVRQAKLSFAVTKSHVEKNADGTFELKQTQICQRAIMIDVIDSANGKKPQFQFAPENCSVELDDKAGLGTYQAQVLLGGSLEDNSKTGRKTYTPIAVLQIPGRNILMTTIAESPAGDMKDIYFNLPEGDQDFFMSQKIVVGVRLEDRL